MGLQRLPVELVWRIFVLARSASLPNVCRFLMMACAQAPRAVLCEYLLASWLDSYALRFTRGRCADASIPALASKFVPTTFPASGVVIPQRRAATADVLSYVARFGICTPALLGYVEQYVLRTQLCGNICQLHGLFVHGRPSLYPTHLACHTVPERLVRAMAPHDLDAELAQAPPDLRAPLRTLVDILEAMVPTAFRTPAPPRPSLTHLELFLRLVLLHRASPNSMQGYPLAMAVHRTSLPMVCLLLALGADPNLKQGIALQLAAKKGWLEGLRTLVERDDPLEKQWRVQVHVLSETLYTLVALRMRRERPPPRRAPEVRHAKRQRLSDRCKLEAVHLQVAVRAQAWDVVAYMMQNKGVVPDVDTLRLLDVHTSS